MKGLAPHTQQIFEAVSKLDCIKPYLWWVVLPCPCRQVHVRVKIWTL